MAIYSTTYSTTIVVIPTYNEQENIALLLTAIFDLKMGVDILVVDDNSPDGTADTVAKMQQSYPNQLHLLNRPKQEGLGTAYLAGFFWALDYGYSYICSMDADFSHAPSDLPKLLNRKDKISVVIGSRYIADGRIINWPASRILLSYLANWIARSITGIPVQDATAGFVCYPHSILQDILLLGITATGYSFQVETKFLAHQYGAQLVEMPITFTNRRRGISKMNFTIAGEGFLDLLKMKWRNWFKK